MLTWHPLNSRSLSKVNPLAPPDWPAILAGSRVDPYLTWADATEFSGFATQPVLDHVSIAFEFRRPVGPLSAPAIASLFRGQVFRFGRRFGVGAVPVKLLQLLLEPRVQRFIPRFELGLPLTGAAAAHLSSIGTPPLALAAAAASGASTTPWAAAIDDGCPFAHRAFRSLSGAHWTTRIEALWFQEDRSVNPGFDRTLLERWINAGATPGAVDEGPAYAAARAEFLRRLQATHSDPAIAERWWQRMQAPASHGAHVLDVFAGQPNPLAARYGLGIAPDEASEAPIIFVQLPRAAVEDTSGLSMNVSVLEALAFIHARVPSGHPTVINLSFGSLAGPHDGSSLIESAIDDFLQANPHMKIVIPAGNSYDSLTHASVLAAPDMRWHNIALRLLPDDPTDTFVELWYDAEPASAGPSHGRPLIDVELFAPDGTRSGVIALNCASEARDPGSALPIAAVINQSRPPTATHSRKQSALIAIAATNPPRSTSRGRAPHGVWTLRVANRGGTATRVDAWIERDDSAFGSGRSRGQAIFLSEGVSPAPGHPHAATPPIDRRACLNSIAHGECTMIVGGSVLRTRELATYSGSGPGRRGPWPGPEYVAPCEDAAGQGLQAAGTRSGSLIHMNGTSVSAPIVARQLVNAHCQLPLRLDPDGLRAPPVDHPEDHPLSDPNLRRGRGLVKP